MDRSTSSVYRVPKKKVEVKLFLAESQRLDCSIFLAESSSRRDGPETVDEFLNEDSRYFIPVFVQATERNIMVSRKLIILLTAPRTEAPPEGSYNLTPTATAEVRVDLFNGEHVEGTVNIYSEIQNSRVSDFLNDERHFLPIFTDEDVTYISRDFIRSVEEREKPVN